MKGKILLVSIVANILLMILMSIGYNSSKSERLTLEKNITFLENDSRAKSKVYTNKELTKRREINCLNETVGALHSLVLQYKKNLKKPNTSATVFKTETIIDYRILKDTVFIKESFLGNVELINNDWVKNVISINEDSLKISLSVNNQYSVVVGYFKEKGLFKPKKLYADVKAFNPYTKVRDVRTYQVKQKRRLFSVGPYIGFDAVALRPSVGVALSYNLIKF